MPTDIRLYRSSKLQAVGKSKGGTSSCLKWAFTVKFILNYTQPKSPEQAVSPKDAKEIQSRLESQGMLATEFTPHNA